MTGRHTVDAGRTTLVACTLPLIRAEIGDLDEFSRLLGAEVARPWPPPLNDEQSQRWILARLESDPDAALWTLWYIELKRGPGERPLLIGSAGFKGPPTEVGTVEIGYSIVEEYQGRGIGTEVVAALVAHAFRDPRVTRVIAETFPELIASIRVLEKNGFRRIAEEGLESGGILFEVWRG
jgi:RimJ/RimL family protein N-acetyltransferase